MPKIISYFVALIIMTSCASPIYANQSVADFSILFGPDNSKKLVVFVHGFDSDPTRAWTNGEGVSWPDLIKDDDKFSGYTVAMYRYDSPFFTRTSTIEEIATRMLRQIEDKGIFEKYSEIYFITHSMGGLITVAVLQAGKRTRVTPGWHMNVSSEPTKTHLLPVGIDERPRLYIEFFEELDKYFKD